MKIKEIPETLRPREIAFKYGVSRLSDRELLALFIRKGTARNSALEIADVILSHIESLSGLYQLSRKTLTDIHGICDVKATELLALAEISRRMQQPVGKRISLLEDKEDYVNWLNTAYGYAKQEYFVLICLDVKYRVITTIEISKGTLDYSLVHPRDVFREAIESNASRVVLAHNHPSGSMEFSLSDVDVTQTLVTLGEVMGIYVVDHLIVGQGMHESMRSKYPEIFERDSG